MGFIFLFINIQLIYIFICTVCQNQGIINIYFLIKSYHHYQIFLQFFVYFNYIFLLILRYIIISTSFCCLYSHDNQTILRYLQKPNNFILHNKHIPQIFLQYLSPTKIQSSHTSPSYYDNNINEIPNMKNKFHKNIQPNNDKSKKIYKYTKDKNKISQHGNLSENSLIIHSINIPQPIIFIISQHSEYISFNQSKFTISIIKDSNPPYKTYNKVDQLKNKLTSISSIWSSHIKQFLNDSQFVQIFRKNKILSLNNIQYGQSIIKYNKNINTIQQYSDQNNQSPIFSRAYFKLWQILSMNILKNKQNQTITIGCLAQGPGGFIHALIDYRLKHHKQIDKYFAITLKITNNTRKAKDWSYHPSNSYFQSLQTLGFDITLTYGQTGTGDLLNLQNITSFSTTTLQHKKCYLVTGDGGIECLGDQQLHYQQIFNAKLFLAQIITTLTIQQINGIFILKIYDCIFQLTKQLITLLCIFYKKVRIIKPNTSRPANSQKYLLCQHFIGITSIQQSKLFQLLKYYIQIQPNINYFSNKQYVLSLLNFSNIQTITTITHNIQQITNYFIQQQYKKLLTGLSIIQQNNNNINHIQYQLKQSRYREQIYFAYHWCKKYGIPTIELLQEEL